MEAKTLEQLTSLILAAHGRQIEGTDIPLILQPSNVNVVSLEQYQKNRSRFRGTLKTSSLKDFVTQAVDRKDDSGKGFIDAKSATELACTIIHNLGNVKNPGHADDKTVLQLEPTVGFKALVKVDGEKHEQKGFAEWLEDWSSYLTAHDENGADIPLARAVAAIRKITVEAMAKAEHQVGDMAATRTAMDSIAATSTEKLPTGFRFNCVPFDGLTFRVFELRLGVLTGSGKPVPVVRWVQREAQIEEIKQEFKERLNSEIGGFFPLVLGSFTAGN